VANAVTRNVWYRNVWKRLAPAQDDPDPHPRHAI